MSRKAWQALADGQSAPDLDPDLEQAIYEAFTTSDGYQVDQLCEGWLDLARQAGITVDDAHGEVLPDVLDAISHTVTAAIWYGLTTAYLTLTSRYHIPADSPDQPGVRRLAVQRVHEHRHHQRRA